MTGRARARDVVLLLYLEAATRDRDGQPGDGDELRITTTTLRSWVHRGHITRGPGGYDLGEILAYLERRTRDTHHSGQPDDCPRSTGVQRLPRA